MTFWLFTSNGAWRVDSYSAVGASEGCWHLGVSHVVIRYEFPVAVSVVYT